VSSELDKGSRVEAERERTDPSERLTHLDEDGAARMVDVGSKPATERVAVAEARVRMSSDAAAAVERGDAPKGDVLGTARIAGIQAAKRATELIPLAHPLPLTFVDVRAEIEPADGLVVLTAEARTVDRTGVELEAMTACSVAALTVYDMVKGIERGVEIERVALVSKSGGRSGEWSRGSDELP
jgi:cyclic pyranopterin monophosphate synthase